MKVFYICHSMNQQTGIGRMVNSIIDSVQQIEPGLTFTVATSEDLLPINHKLKLFFNFRKLLALAREARVIHAFDAYPYGFLAVIIGGLVKRPVILTAVGTGSIKGLSRWPISWFMAYAFKRATKITAISHYVKKEIQKVVPNLEIDVICPGIGDDWLRSEVNKNMANPFAGRNYILSVGSFKKRKGYDLSLKVFKLLAERNEDLYYVIVADSEKNNGYYQLIQQMIADLGLSRKVLIVSGLTDEQLKVIYRDAGLFILLSQNDKQDVEGFGLVFLEAAAMGVPVIGSLGAGSEDALRDNFNGYLVNPGETVKIADKAFGLLADRDLRNRLAQNSLLFAEEMVWRKMVKPYVQIYQKFQS